MVKSASISECGQYRYSLVRRWDGLHPILTFVMLNPSTADAMVDDPTIRKCIGFARRLGFGGIRVLNLYALRTPKPADLWKHPDPIGPENDLFLRELGTGGSNTIVAWGTNAKKDRVARVLQIIGRCSCLKLSKDGHPWHPLYVSYDHLPRPFESQSDQSASTETLEPTPSEQEAK